MSQNDYIRYRIPGASQVTKNGSLELVRDAEIPKGFILTTFQGDAVYKFVEDLQADGALNAFNLTETTKVEYLKSASAFIETLKQKGGKAVLSRLKKVQSPLDKYSFFQKLCDVYPNAFVYEFQSKTLGSWVGATPETLLDVENEKGKTMALAGTRATDSSNPWKEKEFEEHELVADFIASKLQFTKLDDVKRSKRKEIISGPVKHLLTEFHFNINNNGIWELATRLHPTPAVSGWPVQDSLELIEKEEQHNRSFYAGIIGVIGENTKLYVNLRCAQYDNDGLYLYLGGGFTKDSVAEEEWMETENKAQTLINVLKNG